MLNKKRVLVSIGAGIFISVIGLFSLLLMYRILNSPEWMMRVMMWILLWPILLLAGVFPILHPGSVRRVMLGFSIGFTIDVAILSGIIYAVLSLLKRKSTDSPTPPPPLPFE